MNLISDVERRFEDAPDRLGLIFEDGREFTYEGMDENASRVARLLEEKGIELGDLVVIYMQNSPELVFTLFGAWKLGAVPVPVNVMYETGELLKVIDKTDPSLLVADRRNVEVVDDVAERFDSVYLTNPGAGPASSENAETADAYASYDRALAEQQGGHRPAADLPDDHEAAVLSTGGTTGDPKFVSLTHDRTYDSLSSLASEMRGGRSPPHPTASEDVPPNLVTLPLFHGGGQQTLLFAYHVGRSVVLLRRFRVETCVELVDAYDIDNLVLMPTMIYDLVDYDGDVSLDSVESVLSTGQKLDLNLRRRFERRFDIPILENYGATEVGHVAGWTMKDVQAGEWKPGSAGKIYDGVDVEIRDEDDEPLPRGEVGEICVQSGMTKDGYVGDDDDELRVKDGWVYTGDMGYIDEDGVLFIVGRKREMIKCGGFQVWPAELEETLLENEAVDDACIVGVPDERMGEIPFAFVVSSETGAIDEESVIEYTREMLSKYKAVRRVEFLEELPRTDAGKVQRGNLQERAEALHRSGTERADEGET